MKTSFLIAIFSLSLLTSSLASARDFVLSPGSNMRVGEDTIFCQASDDNKPVLCSCRAVKTKPNWYRWDMIRKGVVIKHHEEEYFEEWIATGECGKARVTTPECYR